MPAKPSEQAGPNGRARRSTHAARLRAIGRCQVLVTRAQRAAQTTLTVFWMTMINRSAPHAVPGLALTETELVLLDRLVPDKPQARTSARTLSSYLIKVARLGGYLARSRDPPPGNIVMWRGLSRLTDITLGAKLARTAPICG